MDAGRQRRSRLGIMDCCSRDGDHRGTNGCYGIESMKNQAAGGACETSCCLVRLYVTVSSPDISVTVRNKKGKILIGL